VSVADFAATEPDSNFDSRPSPQKAFLHLRLRHAAIEAPLAQTDRRLIRRARVVILAH